MQFAKASHGNGEDFAHYAQYADHKVGHARLGASHTIQRVVEDQWIVCHRNLCHYNNKPTIS